MSIGAELPKTEDDFDQFIEELRAKRRLEAERAIDAAWESNRG